jgi:hypothetical protein
MGFIAMLAQYGITWVLRLEFLIDVRRKFITCLKTRCFRMEDCYLRMALPLGTPDATVWVTSKSSPAAKKGDCHEIVQP